MGQTEVDSLNAIPETTRAGMASGGFLSDVHGGLLLCLPDQ